MRLQLNTCDSRTQVENIDGKLYQNFWSFNIQVSSHDLQLTFLLLNEWDEIVRHV